MFFRNIGKRIHLLASLLAVVTFVGMIALALLFLVMGFRSNDATLRTAGIESAILFFVLALVLPLFSWILYGFGSLIEASERQAEQSKETRDMLKKALAEGSLSDEVARKTGVVLAKLNTLSPANRTVATPARPVMRPVVRNEVPTPRKPMTAFAEPEIPTEPVAQPATEPVAQPATEPVAQPATGPAAQPATGPVAQPATGPAAQPATGPAAQPVAPTRNSPEVPEAHAETSTPFFAPVKPTTQPQPSAEGTRFVPPTPAEPVPHVEPFLPDGSNDTIKPIRPFNAENTY